MGLLQVKNIAETFIDVVLPKECIGCGKWHTWFCGHCEDSVPLMINDLCIVCNESTSYGIVHAGCIHKTPLTGMVSAAEDKQLLRKVVHCLKYERVQLFSLICAKYIEKRLEVHPYLTSLLLHSNTIIIPVPLHMRSFWDRGFNQSEYIAKHVFGKSVCANLVVKKKATSRQATLDRKKRLQNIKNAFEIINPELVMGRSVIIVDDIITTGATVSELAQILLEAGAKDIWALSVAHVQ